MRSKSILSLPTMLRYAGAAVHLLKAGAALADLINARHNLLGLIGSAIALTLALGGLHMLAVESGWNLKNSKRSDRSRRRLGSTREVEQLRRSPNCPFARGARLVIGSVRFLRSDHGLDRRVLELIPRFIQMTKRGRDQCLDGFILRLPASYGRDVKVLGRTLNRILRLLAQNDPTGYGCFSDDILAENWQFSFNRTRFFVTTFAPFYGPAHSRYSGSRSAAFIYFQPEYSFDHHGIFDGNPNRDHVKDSIRDLFREAGIPYDVELIKQPIEALKYIKPLRIGDCPVEWWKCE